MEDRYEEVRQLIAIGKEKGYLLHEEVEAVLPADLTGSDDLEALADTFRQAGIALVESAPLEPDDRPRHGADVGVDELDLSPAPPEKHSDPMRPYLRDVGAVPLLTRKQEVTLAKRIRTREAGRDPGALARPERRAAGHPDGRGFET